MSAASNNPTSFDPTKPVQTRNGCKVRILCTDKKNTAYPIVALVTMYDKEAIETYSADGRCYSDGPHELDLINIQQRHKHADCIIAWANGARVERYNFILECWESQPTPTFDTSYMYRVKP